MPEVSVFDEGAYMAVNRVRLELVSQFLPPIIRDCQITTALDAGCGYGFFSNHLTELGLAVAAFDARAANVDETRRRYPTVVCYVHDVEDQRVLELGSFDLVCCFGLLYHLENPFRAIRHLSALTRKVMLVESRVAPDPRPMAALVDDFVGDDQALRAIAFVPSEAAIVRMLYASGLEAVYRLSAFPDHNEFRRGPRRKGRRTVLVGTRIPLHVPQLRLVPSARTADTWDERWMRGAGRLWRLIRRRDR